MRALIPLVLLAACSPQPDATPTLRPLPMAEYQDKVYASWLGQIVGNTYGLSYEFQFLEEPGPDDFPLGYGAMLDRVREVDGAFSDDDTDIEYMYLLQMEQHGIEPSYEQLAEAWQHHVRTRIWAANRVALTLMRHGYGPPLTGDSLLNPRWFEIDPQLVNEVWAVTAPGMVDYAAQKTDWAASITNDLFGKEPAIHYGAMYAAAFFESDVDRLIEIGIDALPDSSRFEGMIREMQQLHRQHPNDWQAARAELAARYYTRQPYNRFGWEPIDALLNGAAGILALLYGEGDIQRTLDLASAIGFDADNQAATMTGLLALAQGTAALPRDLLFPLPGAAWTEPFNDRYVNVTRFDLPDASLRDLARRMADQGVAVALANGGRLERDTLWVPVNAQFRPALELPAHPPILATAGEPLRIDLKIPADQWTATGLPTGLSFAEGVFSGVPAEPGTFEVGVTASRTGQTDARSYQLEVRSPNLAPAADRVIHHEMAEGLEAIRDGSLQEPVFYSSTRPTSHEQIFGYVWERPVSISRLGLQVGFPREEWGWLVNPRVEVLSAGEWIPMTASITPDFPAGETKYLQPGFVQFDIRFDPVETTAVRIRAEAGGDPVDGEPTYGTAISELSVHAR